MLKQKYIRWKSEQSALTIPSLMRALDLMDLKIVKCKCKQPKSCKGYMIIDRQHFNNQLNI